MRLDPQTLQDLAVALRLQRYVRVTRMIHADTPLGAGFGQTGFASPNQTFKVIYLAADLTTSVAETLVRDRFEGQSRRALMIDEVSLWGASEVTAPSPLTLIDLRTTGLVRLGVSTDAVRGKVHGQGRKLSQAIHDQTDAAGVLYSSRLTGAACVCLYERALPGPLAASPVVPLEKLAAFVPALQALNVSLIAPP